MKVLSRAALMIGLFFFAGAVPVFSQEYKADQVILSWSLDNTQSQTLTWKSGACREAYVQYSEYRQGETQLLEKGKRIKAVSTKAGKDYWRCEAVITGLKPGTSYLYRIGDGTDWTSPKLFTTAGKTDSCEFLYMGDVQYQNREKDYPAWGQMVQDIRERNPAIAFGILGGDMVNSSKSMRDWNLFLENASPVFSHIPMMTAVGNHETDVTPDLCLTMLALPENGPEGLEEEFYSFDYGNCHILVLNSSFFLEERKKNENWQDQLEAVHDWILADLAESEATWKIAVTHHPIYGVSKGDPICDELRLQWEPLLEQGGIDLVLCGHQHVYMRTKELGGFTQIMGNSGKRRSAYFDGANTPEYSQALDAVNSNYQIIRAEEHQLSVLSYDEEGQIIDKWTKKEADFELLKSAGIGFFLMTAAGAGALLSIRKRT
ncbi:metallophosphoesterase family protein [bacterium 210820-DFI.6.37]|nr:metallophosphoesterase family protein [bacterium 210820-DFI.6.37]